jgi:hypothetical protein
VSTQDTNSPTWRELAKRTAEQEDPEKVLQLAQELIRALDKQSDQRTSQLSEKA